MTYTVNFEDDDDKGLSWTGEADDEQHAVDLAREELDAGDAPVVDVFQE